MAGGGRDQPRPGAPGGRPRRKDVRRGAGGRQRGQGRETLRCADRPRSCAVCRSTACAAASSRRRRRAARASGNYRRSPGTRAWTLCVATCGVLICSRNMRGRRSCEGGNPAPDGGEGGPPRLAPSVRGPPRRACAEMDRQRREAAGGLHLRRDDDRDGPPGSPDQAAAAQNGGRLKRRGTRDLTGKTKKQRGAFV